MTTRLSRLFAALVLLAPSLAVGGESKRPNIVWIVSEDNGPFLGCYGHPDADTPRLDALAKQGVRYEYAFANAPVCAPTRCTIITGVYPTSLGTEHMRSTYRIPDHVKLFPRYLREAGYYCTNNSKTDYNLSHGAKRDEVKAAWDAVTKGDHAKRKPGQPFFAVYNFTTSHESSLHRPLDESLFDADVELPPYHPQVNEIRANWAMYHRIITRMDAQVGGVLDRLEREGVADDTIVLYYSDHGGILTRSKRFLFDSGTRVPMIARFGRNFAHLAPSAPGTTSQRLVSFIDLAPTVLSLAGVKIPAYMQGHAFLGERATEPPEYVHLFRGRMDERYDLSRAVRDRRYKYIRNYMPQRIYGQHLDYLWKMPTTRAWEREYRAGRCNGPQRQFWEPKPAEELFDTEADPWEVRNLVDDPAHADVLARMRAAELAQIRAVHDAGFLPEGQMIERTTGTTTYAYVRDASQYPLDRIRETADLASRGREPSRLFERLADTDPAVRYWAATGCVVLKEAARPAVDRLRTVMQEDTSGDVRLAAAEALCGLGHAKEAVPVIAGLLEDSNAMIALHAANVLEEIGKDARPVLGSLEKAAKQDGYVGRAASHTAETLRTE